MEFSKLNAPTLKELFVAELEGMILSGKLGVGTCLPPERILAQNMQVSRSVVNAGLSELAKKGFLEIHPRVGTTVADYRKNGTLETFISILQYNGGILRREEVRSILQLRKAFDVMAVSYCIPHASDKDLNALTNIIVEMETAISIDEVIEKAYSFQHELALLSGNTFMPIIFSSFKEITSMLWRHFCTLYGVTALKENTRELYERIYRRDLDASLEWLDKTLDASIDGDRPIYY